MKKILISITFIGIFIFSLAYTSNAGGCATFRIHCGDGTGTNTIICGDTWGEIEEGAWELAEAFCD